MKKLLTILLLCTLLFSCLCAQPCLAQTGIGTIEPQYDHTQRTRANITISANGIATCSGYIKAIKETSLVDITVRLMKKEGSKWTPVATWNKTNQPMTGSIEKK